jgi:hydrogenase maturation protein HypF
MVYQLATKMRLNGYVKNVSDGVHIFFNASQATADSFFQKIKTGAPGKSVIISAVLERSENCLFTDFSIVWSGLDGKKDVLISPDIAMCDNCKKELYQGGSRYRYPFITCTNCGPRYSIIRELPYDRQWTSMEHFPMCGDCTKEYDDVADRRCFSQTNSCNNCSIELSMNDSSSFFLNNDPEKILNSITEFLAQGKVIAIKGIGGYLLICDANNKEIIHLLRSRKNRPSKPFAVLYIGIEQVKADFELNKNEEQLLTSKEAPIVLLSPKKITAANIAVHEIAPGLKRLGIMIPYSPLLELIAHDYGLPLIATSANISGSPIIYKDDDAFAYLFDIADYVVSYNRDIVIPQDDSVVQITKHFGQQIILRRSRGYASSYLNYQPKNEVTVLATGAFLKSSFTLSVNHHVFISQFLGSGESYESQQMYKDTLAHWLQLYAVKPGIILTDKHPGYFSHQYAKELAEKFNAEIQFIQHHEAHFAAVLAENDLLHADEPVMGVVWDGTGLGNDGNIWGGEFFRYHNNEILRSCHFDYFPAIAGDKLALEPRIAALCVTQETWSQHESLKAKFTEIEWNNYQSLLQTTSLLSSSVGRIFDAVASLLNICDKQIYEGEAAMYLQVLAEEYVDEHGFKMDESYFKEGPHFPRISTGSLIQGIIMDIKKGKHRNYIAAKFHYSMVCLVGIVAQSLQVKKICFSGGVFQNALLVDWLQYQYNKKYQIYFHKNLSPNDENISFGQLVYYDNNIKSITELSSQEALIMLNA